MDFAALYKSKLTTPEEAVKVVKSGDWVDYGWCTGTPNALDKALAARMDELENVNFRGGVLMRRPAIFDVPDVADKLTWNSWHMSGIERKACMGGLRLLLRAALLRAAAAGTVRTSAASTLP